MIRLNEPIGRESIRVADIDGILRRVPKLYPHVALKPSRIDQKRLAAIAEQVDRETPDWREYVREITPHNVRRGKYYRRAVIETRDGKRATHASVTEAARAAGYARTDSINALIKSGKMSMAGSRYEFARDE